MTVKLLGSLALTALGVSAGLSVYAQAGQLPPSLAGQAVDEAVASAAADGTLADVARAVAVNRIPAGFVLGGDDHRPTRVTRNEQVGRMRPLGEALSALVSRRPDVNPGESGGALFVAKEGSACVPHNHAPKGPVGIVGSILGEPGAVRGGRAVPVIPTTARVTLIYPEITLIDALQQVALQAPGIVWAVIERPRNPRCQLNLYHPDGVLVVGGDILSGG